MKIRLINLEDWQGLYIDDNLVMENHSLELSRVMRKILPLDSDFKVAYIDEFEDSNLPQEWSDEFENKSK